MVVDTTNGKTTLTASKDQPIVIRPPQIETIRLHLRGTAPYAQHRWSKKAQDMMAERMKEGSTAKTARGSRKPRDFDSDFEEAKHISTEGWYGIPAPAFRNAAIDVCRLAGFAMTKAKMSIFITPDGYDRIDGTPLVRLLADEPERWEATVRNASGVADIRVRPRWHRWETIVTIRYDARQFKLDDIVNLIALVGAQCGIGEGRPFSKDSNGLDFGLFEIINPPRETHDDV